MVYFIFTRDGWDLQFPNGGTSLPVWVNFGVLTEAELAARRAAGEDLTSFSHPIDPSDPEAFAGALCAIAEHHPIEEVYLEVPGTAMEWIQNGSETAGEELGTHFLSRIRLAWQATAHVPRATGFPIWIRVSTITESEWRSSTDPEAMLTLVGNQMTGRHDRLFGAVCLRRVWHRLGDERLRKAIRVSERFAEGEATVKELGAAIVGVHRARGAHENRRIGRLVYDAVRSHRTDVVQHFLAEVSAEVATLLANEAVPDAPDSYTLYSNSRTVHVDPSGDPQQIAWRQVRQQELARHCGVLRDLVGDPFDPVDYQALSRMKGEPAVRETAERIYQEARFDELPGLCAALERIPGVPRQLLAHFRTAEPHMRGCWALDMLLGRGGPVAVSRNRLED